MKATEQHIQNILGVEIHPEPIAKQQLGRLPMYLPQTYKLYQAELFHIRLLLAVPKQLDELSILQTQKNFKLLADNFNKKVVLILPEITAFNRKRLLEKGINFIVPGKQLYLPDLLIDLRETFQNPSVKQKNETLLPSAQFLVIWHLLHKKDDRGLENRSFKEIAKVTGYTPMAITKAVEDLKFHHLIDVKGEKEKSLQFKLEGKLLWQHLLKQKLLASPILKTVFVDEKPKGILLMFSNTSALPVYSDLNQSRQEFYALEKQIFYELQKNNTLINPNENEGKYCLEVWKYNPANILNNKVMAVDPLSLYLCLMENKDERIEMALQQMMDKIIW